MRKIIPNKARNILNILQKNNYEAYIIGGAIRNYLCGLESSDFDIVTSATPEQICELFQKSATVGNNFLVTLIDDIEVATFRKDKVDCAEVAKTLEEDVSRRDFTINAIAYDVNKNIFIDLIGGMQDLNNKILRFIGNPDKRIIEDPVRILRGIRFASQFNLKIEQETFYAMVRNKHLLQEIPRERIFLEIKKAFSLSGCSYRFLTLLKELGIFRYIFPTILELEGLDGGKHHRETVFEHSLYAVKALDNSKNWKLKLAALYHDCGKKYYEIDEDGNFTFKQHHSAGLCDLGLDLLHGLKLSNEYFMYIRTLVAHHMSSIDSSKSTKKLCAKLYASGVNIKDFILLRYADKKSNMARENITFSEARCNYKKCLKVLNEKPPFCVKDLEISGKDVMSILNLTPSPKVGKILRDIFEKVLNEELENKRDILLDYLTHLDK